MKPSDDASSTELAAARAEIARLARRLAVSRSALIVTDHDYYITEWGAAAERVFRYSASEMRGHHLLELFVEDADFELALGSGIDVRRGAVTVRHRRRDGSLVWVQLLLVPELDESGEPVGWLAQAIDVQAEVSEIEQTRLRSRVFDIVPLPIAIADADGIVLSANAAWLHCFGTAAERVLGRVCPLLDGGNGSVAVDKSRDAVLGATGHWSGAVDYPIDEQMTLRIDVTISAIVGDLGRRVGFLVLVTSVRYRGSFAEIRSAAVAAIDH